MLASLVCTLLLVAAPVVFAAQGNAASPTPLLDYAQEMPLPEQPLGDGTAKRLASVQAEMERHPPPPADECIHTLGASRFAQSYDDLGEALSEAGDFDGAISTFEKALACAPRTPAIHAALGSALLNVGRLTEARATVERGLALGREGFLLDSVLLRIDFIEEHWANAVARLRTVAITEPDDERAAYWQCFLWLAQRRAGTRQPELVARTDFEGWPAPILDTLRGKLSEAELLSAIQKTDYERRRRERLTEALYYIGQLRLAKGDKDTARRYFAAAVNLKVLYFIEHPMALAEIAKMRAAAPTAPDLSRTPREKTTPATAGPRDQY